MAPLDEPAPVITPPNHHIQLLPGVRTLVSSSQWRPYNEADPRLTTLLQQTSGTYFYHTCVVTRSDETTGHGQSQHPLLQATQRVGSQRRFELRFSRR